MVFQVQVDSCDEDNTTENREKQLKTMRLLRFLLQANQASGGCGSRINHMVNMESSKVVHKIAVEDIAKRVILCRCWQSKKFPYCDGSHAKHNKETGDNLGPVIIIKGGEGDDVDPPRTDESRQG